MTPERTIEQRHEALRYANLIRSRRAQLKRDIKAQRVDLHLLLIDPPDWLLSAKIIDLLICVPKYGRVKANKVLTSCRIAPTRSIGAMSHRQRLELVACTPRRPLDIAGAAAARARVAQA